MSSLLGACLLSLVSMEPSPSAGTPVGPVPLHGSQDPSGRMVDVEEADGWREGSSSQSVAPTKSPSAVADWWKLAFEEQRWEEAVDAAIQQKAPDVVRLAEVLMLEAEEERLADDAGRLPGDPGVRQWGLADRWERWALTAAFEGAQDEALRAALAHGRTHGQGDAHKRRLDRAATFLLDELGSGGAQEEGAPSSRRERLAAAEQASAWSVHEKGNLPLAPQGITVLLAGTFRLKGAMKIPNDAELWIERGAYIQPSGEESKIVVNGVLRVFGASGKPVRIGSNRDWIGIDYESTVRNLLCDVVIRRAKSGVHLRGEGLFVLDSVFEDCENGFHNESSFAWCERVLFEDSLQHGFWTSTNGGIGSWLSSCTLQENGVGARTSFRQTLYIWNCEFKKNEIPVQVLHQDAGLVVHTSNFLGKKPLRLLGTVSFDLRQNWWGSRSPNITREISFQGGGKTGDALMEPVLKEPVEGAGAPKAD